MRWQYYSWQPSMRESPSPDKRLNEFGDAGWELVSVSPGKPGLFEPTFYFKRPKED